MKNAVLLASTKATKPVLCCVVIVQTFAICVLNFVQEVRNLQTNFANFVWLVAKPVLLSVKNTQTTTHIAKPVQKPVANVQKPAKCNDLAYKIRRKTLIL